MRNMFPKYGRHIEAFRKIHAYDAALDNALNGASFTSIFFSA